MSRKKRIKKATSNRGKRLNHKESSKRVDTTQYPSFSFRFCCDRAYGIDRCSSKLRESLSKRIFRFSRMKWSKIYQNARHSWGSEQIPQREIKPELPDIISPDTSLQVLRFTGGNHSMIGFRENGIFFILYLDHNFSVYNHG